MAIDKTKPFIIALLGVLVLAIIGVIGKGFTSGSLSMENADFLRQKMAPALNETTGFLVISYAVILSIGNVIMKTSPKYLQGLTQGTSKTSGFVAWLQQSNMSWLPVLVSLGVTAVASLMPINNKVVKILIVSGTLLGALVASLFFNAIAKLFTAKESFTNVKEEFGHLVENKPHNLTINVGSNKNNDIYTSVNYSDDGEGVDKHNMEAIYNEHTYEINGENLTNTILVKMLKNSGDVKSRIFITDKPISQTSGDHNAREVSQTAGEEISITVEGPTKKIYVHAITDSITDVYQEKFDKIVNPTEDAKQKEKKAYEDAKKAIEDYIAARTEVENAKAALVNKGDPRTVEDKTADLETKTKAYSDAIYNALLKISGKPVDEYLAQTVSSAADGGNVNRVKGLIITLKNMEQFFGFDAGKVKDSVRASYIAYYSLVWISFLVYMSVNAFQQKKWIWNTNKPWPFIIAAFVETLLIGQSHYSLDESDVGEFKQASPTFSYAVAGFSTRIATVVAFLSSILTQVKD
tara:strand:- start:4 stop:1569 length:1566 start_codon:yes stop_codon:yes gene_type:complete